MGFGRWWSRRGRSDETHVDEEIESRVQILLVEEDPRFGAVAHVRADGVHIPDPIFPERPNTALGR